MNKIHAAHFLVSLLAFLGGFIKCKNRSDFQMGAYTLVVRAWLVVHAKSLKGIFLSTWNQN
jgi:hypothetical protein